MVLVVWEKKQMMFDSVDFSYIKYRCKCVLKASFEWGSTYH